MCFSQKNLKKNTLKLSSEKSIKNKIFTDKDQLYLISNKEFISRNYKKLQKIRENTSKSKLQFLMEKEQNLSLKIKTPNHFDRKLLIQKDLMNFNSTKNKNNNSKNKIYYSLSGYNASKNELYKKYINDGINTYKERENYIKKYNKAKSLDNLRYANLIKNNKKHYYNPLLFDFNKMIRKESKNKNKNKRKNNKYPLSNDFFKIKMLYLNMTTKHKSVNFSKNSFDNSSKSKIMSANQSKERGKKLNIEKLEGNNLLIIKKFKNLFYSNNKNKRLNKSNSKQKKKKSLNFFNDIYNKIIKKSTEKNLIFLRLKQLNKSKNSSFLKNKNKTTSSKDVNSLMTSGSISEDEQKYEEKKLEINPEEIHFLSIKYIQEIKKNIFQ